MRDELQGLNDPDGLPAGQNGAGAAPIVQTLRILATTDLHMQLVGHDYILDRPIEHAGLAGLATLIRHARAEARQDNMASILIDNGDLLQGSALGETLRQSHVDKDHAVAACLRALGYDAIGLGNHDLDHGPAYLCQVAAAAALPVISTNLDVAAPSPLLRSLLLPCALPQDPSTKPRTLTIGLISVLPERTALWNAGELKGWATVQPAQASVTEATRDLRQNGADLVVVMAHMGVEGPNSTDAPADDARRLAALPGVDVLIAGHTHLRLPGQDHTGYALVDGEKGTLNKRPAVMPGFEASDLAVLDLNLTFDETTGWKIVDHVPQLWPNSPDVPPDPHIVDICRPAHEHTRRTLAQPCGYSEVALQNFFSLAAPTATCALVASAKEMAVRAGIEGSKHAELPIVVAASAHTAGGRGGPQHFQHIPPGTIYRRHLKGLSPYNNEICALRVTGEELRNWLEHAAGVYQRLLPDQPDQLLCLPHRPAFDFDTIYGLDYALDPTQPAGSRLTHLHHEGRPVSPEQEFILATNQFRAAGGGGGKRFDTDQIVFQSALSVTQALAEALTLGAWRFPLGTQPWRFECATRVQAVIQSAPQAINHLRDISHLSPRPLGLDELGFSRIRLSL